jgi:hypothetical protein
VKEYFELKTDFLDHGLRKRQFMDVQVKSWCQRLWSVYKVPKGSRFRIAGILTLRLLIAYI